LAVFVTPVECTRVSSGIQIAKSEEDTTLTNHTDIDELRNLPQHTLRDVATVRAVDEELYRDVLRVARRLLRRSGQAPHQDLDARNGVLAHLGKIMPLTELAKCLSIAIANRRVHSERNRLHGTNCDTQLVRSVATRIR
jgi:hypothetical protein